MHSVRILFYILLFIGANLFLLSCNNGAEESSSESTYTDEIPDESISYDHTTVGAGKKPIRDRLVKKYKDLLVFHADDTMEVNTTYMATLALSRNMPLGPLKMRVLDASDATDDNVLVDSTIELGKRIRADLRDV